MSNNNNFKNKNSNKNNNNKNGNNNNKTKVIVKKVRPNSFRYIRNRNPAPIIARNQIDQMMRNYKNGIRTYLRGLLFPEDAISGSYICKQPSYIGLPTSNVVYKEQINFTVGDSKKFGLIWVPSYLSTVPSLTEHIDKCLGSGLADNKKKFYSHLYFKTDLSQPNQWNLHTSFVPDIDLAKYRLVSAKISVQYNGTLMTQSGQMHSCVVYDDLPVFIGYCDNNIEDPSMDLSQVSSALGRTMDSYLDIEKIRNGLWPKYVNITNTTGQIDNIALPTDPTDHTFFPLTHYYAIEPVKVFTQLEQGLGYASSTDGGHLSYVYLGDGLPENSNMTVIIYYNFEIIATQSSATFLRGKKEDGSNPIRHFISSKEDIIIEEVSKFASQNNNLSAPGTGSTKVANNNVMRFIKSFANILTGALAYKNMWTGFKNALSKFGPSTTAMRYGGF
jgi:hypothetical protein